MIRKPAAAIMDIMRDNITVERAVMAAGKISMVVPGIGKSNSHSEKSLKGFHTVIGITKDI